MQKNNLGYNSFRGLRSKTKRILEYVNSSKEVLSPKQIAKRLQIKRSTVKVVLRRLAKDGLICRIGYGEYCSFTTYGVVKPLRVHNLRFRIEGLKEQVKGKRLGSVLERVGDAEIYVRFGEKRGLVTGWLKCDRGFDYQSLVFAVRFLEDIIKRKVGVEPKGWVFTSKEWNVDHIGVRLDNRNGFRCLTIQEFEDFLVRVYQKDAFTVRAEVKDSQELSLDDLLAFMRGGNISGLRDARIINQIVQRLDAQAIAIRFMNRKIMDLEKSLVKVTDALDRLVEPLSRLADLSEKGLKESGKGKRPEWMV